MDVVEKKEGVSAPKITLVKPKAASEVTLVKQPKVAIKTTAVKPEATETTLVEPETAIAKLEFTTLVKPVKPEITTVVELEITTAPACSVC